MTAMNFYYARKSTDTEDRQVLSLSAQRDEILKLAMQDGVTNTQLKTFEESMSARKPGRPIFNKLIAELTKGKDHVLYCWKLNRLARNPMDGGNIIYLMDLGCISEIRTFGKTYFNTPTDKFMMAIDLGTSKMMVDELSIDVTRGLEKKLRTGGWTSKAPFGYLNKVETKSIVVDPLRAPYVQQIFQLFSTGGYSLKETAEKFYEQGLRTRSGKKIHASLLYRMMTNPFYTGVMLRGGKHYQGNHEALISKDLFDTCQNILNGNRGRKQKHLFPFRGYMSCPTCGCSITATLARGHQYYHCTNGKHMHEGSIEHNRAESLNEQFAARLQEIQFDEEMIEIMHQAAIEESKNNNSFIETARENILTEQKTLLDKRKRVEDAFFDGSLPGERYKARILEIDNLDTDFKNQLTQLEKKMTLEGKDTIEQTKKAFLTALYAEKDFLWGNDLKKRELIEILLSNMTVKEQKIQSIQYKPVYQIMVTTQKKLDYLGWSG